MAGVPAATDTVLMRAVYEPRDEQIALIRTAAPDVIVDRASIWVVGRDGYALAVEGTSGFGCLLQRGLEGEASHSALR